MLLFSAKKWLEDAIERGVPEHHKLLCLALWVTRADGFQAHLKEWGEYESKCGLQFHSDWLVPESEFEPLFKDTDIDQ